VTPEQAGWVRANAWRGARLRNHNHISSTTFECACQGPPSVECQIGRHSACTANGRPVNETFIHTTQGRAARFPEPYTNRSPVNNGANNMAQVWLAGTPCRRNCNCPCHQGTGIPESVRPPAQLGLFAAVTA
jgi:hypothetical protein